MFSLIRYELSKSYFVLVIFSIFYISMIVSIGTLLTVTMTMRSNYYNAYGNSYFIIEGFDFNDYEIIKNEKFNFDIYNIENYTMDLVDGDKACLRYGEKEIDAFFDCIYDKRNNKVIYDCEFSDYKSIDYEMNDFNFYRFNGIFRNDSGNNSLAIKLNTIVANELSVGKGDVIAFIVDGIETNLIIDDIYDFGDCDYSFICSIDFFKYRPLPQKNTARISIIDNYDYSKVKKTLDKHNIKYIGDKTFENYNNILKIVTLTLCIVSAIIVVLFGFGVYTITNNYLESRKEFIKKLKIVGASNYNLFIIYFTIFFIIYIVGTLPSYFIVVHIIEIIRSFFTSAYEYNYVVFDHIWFIILSCVLAGFISTISIIITIFIKNGRLNGGKI